MTIETTEKVMCDGDKCTHTKDKENHWLVGYKDKGFIMMASSRDRLPDEMFTDTDQEMQINKDNIQDFCGEQCAIKWVSRQLTEIKK